MATFHVWQRCSRCVMTTIDRDSLARSFNQSRGGVEPLTTLSTFRERANGCRNFGVHLIPANPEVTSRGASRGGAAESRAVVRDFVALGGRLEVLEYDEIRRAEWLAKHGDGDGEDAGGGLLPPLVVAILGGSDDAGAMMMAAVLLSFVAGVLGLAWASPGAAPGAALGEL